MSVAVLAAPAASPLADFLDAAAGVLHRLLALPVQASEAAPKVDGLQYVQFVFMWLLGLATFAAAGWFVLRYRRRLRADGPTAEVRAPLWLELGFAAILLGFFVLFWVVGFRQYVAQTVAPDDALEIYVTAKQWVWKFTYPDGEASAGVLYVPRDRPVRLVLTSRDVIHSFFVPAFRVKQDAVPGRYTSTWFVATRAGRFDLMCAELCGAGHSRMWGEVVVLPEERFGLWLDGRDPELPAGAVEATPVTSPEGGATTAGGRAAAARQGLAERGLALAAAVGCLRCHTTDGSDHIAPSWRGLYGSEVRLDDGATVVADEAYLTESMMDPMAKIVAGYDPVMPTYQGRLDAAETAAILHFVKSLREPLHETAPVLEGESYPAPVVEEELRREAPPPAGPIGPIGPIEPPATDGSEPEEGDGR